MPRPNHETDRKVDHFYFQLAQATTDRAYKQVAVEMWRYVDGLEDEKWLHYLHKFAQRCGQMADRWANLWNEGVERIQQHNMQSAPHKTVLQMWQ